MADPKPNNADWKPMHSIGLVVIIVAIAMVGMLVDPIWTKWILIMVFITLFTMLASGGVTGNYWLGWLINEQERISLSRLQMFLWTILILSAYISAVFANIKVGGDPLNALNITIPDELWLAMGISTTSLVASPLINRRKSTLLDEREKSPQLSDLFTSEYDPKIIDLSRMQNLYFTLILVGAYFMSLGSTMYDALNNGNRIADFPELNQTFLALLAVSHAGYLSYKVGTNPPENGNKKDK